MLLIQNGRVLDPYTQMDALCDVLIGDDGVIAQVAEHIDAPAGCTVYDASGLTVSPGFVDGHVHFRDPGQTRKEDVLTGAAAAAAGGYATVICMANTVPTCDTPEIIHYVTDKAKDCPVQVLQAGAVGGVLQQRQQGLIVLLAGSQVIQHPDLLAGCSVCDKALNSIA